MQVKKKATLLIKNIKRVYTMQQLDHEKMEILESAFIAIHHEHILACSCGDYVSYIDEDTRIIDALGHIVIPSFIEPFAILARDHIGQSIRKEMECFKSYMRNGTLNIHTRDTMRIEHQYNYHYELLKTEQKDEEYPILFGSEQLRKGKPYESSVFCLSAGSDIYATYNQLTYAQMLCIKESWCAEVLLKALTIYPAKHLCLSHIGSIAKGQQADLLILSCDDIAMLFQTFGNVYITQIVKKGVRIYPFLLV